MAYPFDGEPNLRPGADRGAFSLAPRYDPALPLDALFEDFLAGSVWIIGDRTEQLYRYDWACSGPGSMAPRRPRCWARCLNSSPRGGSVPHIVDDVLTSGSTT